MKFLNDLNKNAKYCITIEPMWTIFWGLVFFYSPLYMKDIGLTEIEIGLVSTVNLFFSFFCQLLAAPITNRLGRKRTSIIFDLISWSLVMFIWAISKNFWYFLAAGIINSFSKIVMVSWNCLITEDEKKENVSKIYGILSLISSTIGIFAPITGLFIVRFGTVSTLRVLYMTGAVSMTAMFIVRNFLVKETKAGLKLMEDHSKVALIKSIKNYIIIISRLYKNKNFILISILYISMNFIASVNIFQVIFLKDTLNFTENNLSFIPGIIALLNILIFIFLIPRLKKISNEIVLTIFLTGNFISSIFFILIPQKNLLVMLIVMAFAGICNFLSIAYRETVFMNSQGDHDKADMFSAVQVVTTLFCIPAGYIGGLLFKLNSYFPFVLVLFLFLIAVGVSLYISLRQVKEINVVSAGNDMF
jgi:MFS family permease